MVKLDTEKKYTNFCLSIKMQNLSQKRIEQQNIEASVATKVCPKINY